MSLGTLTIDIAANLARLSSDMGKANQIVERELNKIKGYASAAGTALGGIAAGLSVGAFAGFIKGAVDSADAANKQSQQIGISVESLTELQHAADLADMSNEEFTRGMVKLDKSITSAVDGGNKQAAAFKAMGISATDANGQLRNADDVLLDIAEKFHDMPDGAQKSSLALDIFGKTGAKMIPLLNSGRDGIKDLTDEAERMGLVISTRTAQEAEKFNDSLTILHKNSDALAKSIAGDMLPGLNRITAAMIEAHKEGGALYTLWIGLGGVASEALGLNKDDLQNVNSGIKDLNNSIEIMQGTISDNKKYGFNTSLYENQLADLKIRQENLTAYRDKLLSPPEQKKSGIQMDAPDLSGLEKYAQGAVDADNKIIASSERAREAAARAEEQRLKSIQNTIDAWQRQAATLGMTNDEIKNYELYLEGATNAQLNLVRSIQNTIDAAQYEKDAFSKTEQEISKNFDDMLKVEEKRMGDIVGMTDDAVDQMSVFADQAARNMQDSFANFLFDPFKDGLDGMLASFGKILQRMVAEAAASQIFDSIFGAAGKDGKRTGGIDFSGIMSSVSGFFGLGGGKAIGGPVMAGMAYPVGEFNRPELFQSGNQQYLIPGNNGVVKPLNGGSSQPISITINQPGITSANEAREASGATQRAVSRGIASAARYA